MLLSVISSVPLCLCGFLTLAAFGAGP
ncbi:exported hypothetical protein [Magnetospirillum sp. UT-4]|nr:exported hypothetical protein [Magnetospirillum sp. UT-4]